MFLVLRYRAPTAVFAGYLGRNDLTKRALSEMNGELFYRTAALFERIMLVFFIIEEEKIIKSNFNDNELNLEKLNDVC
jgi:hypothetical protein